MNSVLKDDSRQTSNRRPVLFERKGRSLPSVCLSVMVAMLTLLFCGCSESKVERTFRSPFPEAYTVAVVPFRDQSGTSTLDVMMVTDEFYAELQQVDGVLYVLPVNRVLSALNDLGLANVVSPDSALLLADSLGVDGVIVGTITRYDPYDPPQMGMALQLYAREDSPDQGRTLSMVNPGDIAREPRPIELPAGAAVTPRSMVVRIMDAGQEDVIGRIKKYAKERGSEESPMGWKRFTRSRNFVRFVCHEMIGELLALEERRLVGTTESAMSGL